MYVICICLLCFLLLLLFSLVFVCYVFCCCCYFHWFLFCLFVCFNKMVALRICCLFPRLFFISGENCPVATLSMKTKQVPICKKVRALVDDVVRFHINLESAIHLVCDLKPTDINPSSVICRKCPSSLGNRIRRFTTSMRAGRFRGEIWSV